MAHKLGSTATSKPWAESLKISLVSFYGGYSWIVARGKLIIPPSDPTEGEH